MRFKKAIALFMTVAAFLATACGSFESESFWALKRVKEETVALTPLSADEIRSIQLAAYGVEDEAVLPRFIRRYSGNPLVWYVVVVAYNASASGASRQTLGYAHDDAYPLEIAGYMLMVPTDDLAILFANGRDYTLVEAYEESLLSRSDILDIGQRFARSYGKYGTVLWDPESAVLAAAGIAGGKGVSVVAILGGYRWIVRIETESGEITQPFVYTCIWGSTEKNASVIYTLDEAFGAGVITDEDRIVISMLSLRQSLGGYR